MLFPGFHRKAVEKQLKFYLAEGRGEEYIGDFALELLDGRLRMQNVDGGMEVVYGKIGKLVENKNCLYIYPGSMTAVIVPLGSFGSNEAYREYLGRLEEKVRAAKEALGAA